MASLDFGVALQDKRLAPLMQLVALRALDDLFTPLECDTQTALRVYGAALAPSFGEAHKTDSALLCAAILGGMGVVADTPRFAEENGTLMPAFIIRSSDTGGRLGQHRLLVQLAEELRVLQYIFSQSP